MPLEKHYVRDGRNKIVGSVTSGFSDESATVRDEHTGLVSNNTADPGLLIGRKR